ncbi:hypothetical protein P8452_08026 [Trifolium repens]|nr:hypothetical protein P8452_08026 [Trifolium repens]
MEEYCWLACMLCNVNGSVVKCMACHHNGHLVATGGDPFVWDVNFDFYIHSIHDSKEVVSLVMFHPASILFMQEINFI